MVLTNVPDSVHANFVIFPVELRQEADRCPRGKVIRDSFLWTETPRQDIPDQITGGWNLLRPCITCSWSQGTSRPHMCRRILEAKGKLCQGMFYPDDFSVKSILGKRCMCIHGRGSWDMQIWTVNPGKSKWLAKRNPEETLHKVNTNCLEGVTQGLFLSSPCIYPHVLCSFPANEYFTCFATFLFVGILFTSRGNQGLVTEHWSSGQDLLLLPPDPVSGWEPKPSSQALQAKATRD